MNATVRSVAVDSEGGGRLAVRWVVEPSAAVDVSVGPTPEAIDHAHALRVEAGTTTATIEAVDGHRQYVSVAPTGGGTAVVAAERLVPFESVLNFRDLGGYPTAGGGRTRWGRLFRSAALHEVTDVDVERFRALGIRVVYDLRSPREQAAHRDLPGTRRVSLPVFRRSAPRHDITTAADPEEFLTRSYLSTLEHSASAFGELTEGLAAHDGLPAVFHCTVGKDRTGLSAALLLDAVGVSVDDILDDYELTNDHQPPSRWEGVVSGLVERGGDPMVIAGVFQAQRGAMKAALDQLHDVHGGAARYLRQQGGVDESTLGRLTRLLVET